MSSSPPSLPSSDPDFDALFPSDPAPVLPPSNTNSDDLEAFHIQEHELADAKARDGVVIQHRHWTLDDVLRSEEIFNPETPSRTERAAEKVQSSPPVSAELPTGKMPFSSSPMLFPPSSSPPVVTKKRKLFQTLSPTKSKKPRVVESEAESLGKGAEESTIPAENPAIGYAATTTISEPLEDTHSSPPRARSPELPTLSRSFLRRLPSKTTPLLTSSGNQINIPLRRKTEAISYEQLVAQRSVVAEGRAKKAYYGIDIHELLDDAVKEKLLREAQIESERDLQPVESIERPIATSDYKSHVHQMWTEKYRARKFTDLVGDERTHRSVLKWLKAWDSIVFPGSVKAKPKKVFRDQSGFEKQHRKILLLTGPPGLGKTTLAHVCARQAGYEVLEINASDDRSRDVVKGRIKDALGTENVRGIQEQGQARRAGLPVCVVVDEVDGVVTGSGGGGEGGFTKALIDLVLLDQKNASQPTGQAANFKNQKKAGDKFRLLRPLILICNDVYAPSLRPLRNSTFAEIVHVRKAPLERVISRLKNVFESENIPADPDALRRLCEHSWGLGSRKQNTIGSRGSGEGDIRGILVQGEWVAHKLRAAKQASVPPRLTRRWIDAHLSASGNGTDGKGLARGGVREVVERIFIEGAGLPNLPAASLSKEQQRQIQDSKSTPQGVAESRKRTTIAALREMVDTCGEYDRLMTDCFATYATQAYQDDWNMSKANAGYEWLHFHDSLSSRIFGGQEWELNPYLSSGACGFHHLFSVVDKGASGWEKKDNEKEEKEEDLHPFSGARADFAAFEAQKQNSSVLTELQASFSAPLLRLFSSTDAIATELIPNVGKMLAPEVKPVVVGGSGGLASVASVRKESERACIQRSVRVMSALNVSFEKARVEVEGGAAHSNAGFVYRMEPPLDTLTSFQLGKIPGQQPAPVRYAVRQVLDQELRKERILMSSAASRARSTLLDSHVDQANDDKENADAAIASKEAARREKANVKRDFFGRIVNNARPTSAGMGRPGSRGAGAGKDEKRVWVSFNEGYSNAVRKPITLKELMESFV